MDNYEVIFILGPQGSGKGTQEKILAEKIGFYMWDTGKVLRAHRDLITVDGQKVGDIMDRGDLLNDEQLLGVVAPLIAEIPMDKGIIFDGIPRRLGQAEFLINFLESKGRKNFATLFVDIPYEESMKRLLLRAEKEGRPDDTKEAIEVRLKQYEAETVPIIPFLEAHSKVMHVDGIGSIEEVSARIDKALGIS